MSFENCDNIDWDNLSEEEHKRYLIRYEFFDEWLHSDARKNGMTLDEYDEIYRSGFSDLPPMDVLYEMEYNNWGDMPAEGFDMEFYHPDDDED